MPKCPECGKEINELINYQSFQHKYNVVVEERHGGRYIEFYEHDSFIDDSEEAINEYVCPECEQTIFNSDSDAEYFLLGETENGN